ELVLRIGDRAYAIPRGRAPEPAADVAVDRLGVDALLAEAGDEDGRRDLPLPEARDLHAVGEIRDGVLDRVLDLIGRDVHGQADAVLSELLDGRRHRVIQPARLHRPPTSRPAEPASGAADAARSGMLRARACPYVAYCPAPLALASLASDAPEKARPG